MKLLDLLEGPGLDLKADPTLEIRSISYDSRRVIPGSLFFAIAGAKDDGHRFVPQALELGAVAIVSEREAPLEIAGARSKWARVPAIRRTLSEASRRFY